jgi:signal peptidase I
MNIKNFLKKTFKVISLVVMFMALFLAATSAVFRATGMRIHKIEGVSLEPYFKNMSRVITAPIFCARANVGDAAIYLESDEFTAKRNSKLVKIGLIVALKDDLVEIKNGELYRNGELSEIEFSWIKDKQDTDFVVEEDLMIGSSGKVHFTGISGSWISCSL